MSSQSVLRMLLVFMCLIGLASTANGQTAPPVNIPDAALKAAIQAELGISNDPTTADMLNLVNLDAHSAGVIDLTGLEYALNLQDLTIYDNYIDTLGPLSGLTSLTSLDIRENHISDLTPLSGLTNIVSLLMSDNQINDISALSTMTKMHLLQMGNNQISDISALSVMTVLYEVNISYNPVSDISAFAGLTNLANVYLNNCQISDISALANMTNLEVLLLQSNSLNAQAYQSIIPLITNNNPSAYISYDPNPYDDSVAGYVAAGRSMLAEKTLTGLQSAYQIFDEGIQKFGVENDELVFFHACTRAALLLFRDDGGTIDSLFELAGEFGIRFDGESLSPLNITPYSLLNENGFYEKPAGAPDKTGIRQILDTSMIPELDAIIEEFDPISSSFQTFLTPQETGLETDVDVDRSDVTVFWAFLKALRAQLALESAYGELTEQQQAAVNLQIACGTFDIERDLFDAYPDFLVLDPDNGLSRLTQAKADLIDSINDYINAKTQIQAETDDQTDDLFYLDPNTTLTADSVADKLTILRDSINTGQPGEYPWQTIRGYQLEDAQMRLYEMKLVYNLSELSGSEGSLNLPDGVSKLANRWLVTDFEREGLELWADLDPNEYGLVGDGFLLCQLDPENNTLISSAQLELWDNNGTHEVISGLSGTQMDVTVQYQHMDLTPILNGTIGPRDMLPEFGPDNTPQPGTMGVALDIDSTLGGVLPDMTQDDWTKAFDLQPSGDIAIREVTDWTAATVVDGDMNNWYSAEISPVLTDIGGDTEEHPFLEGYYTDIKQLYLAADTVNQILYGAITTYGRSPRDYTLDGQTFDELILSYPGEYKPLHIYLIYGGDQNPQGIAQYGDNSYTCYTANNNDVIEFSVPLNDPPTSLPLPGRYIELNSAIWYNGNYHGCGEDNDTGLKIVQVGDTPVTTSVSGSLTYDSYPGGPITVQFCTDWNDPDGSVVAALEIPEPSFPCNFTLEGIGYGTSGYVRAIGPWAGQVERTTTQLPWVESNWDEVYVNSSPVSNVQLMMGRTWPVGPSGMIQTAIDQASNGDTIVLADGTYTGEGNWDLDFQGKAFTLRSENGPDNCTIDCNNSNHRGFIFQNGETGVSRIEGITVTNAFIMPLSSSEWDLSYCGGGVLCDGSSPTFKNCKFTVNFGRFGGGAVACANGSAPRFIDCMFDSNLSSCGGAVYLLSDSNATFDRCTFQSNFCHIYDEDGFGGAIYCENSRPSFTNCLVVGNWAQDKGGGVYNNASDPKFINCTIGFNIADDQEIGLGGGFFNDGSSSPVITNCIVGENQDSDSDGPVEAMQIRGGTPVVTYSDIQDDDENDSAIPFGGTFNNNIDDNPHFIKNGSWDGYFYLGDYHLQPDSPCINIGHNKSVRDLAYDIVGNDRVLNEVVDLGAYEYNSSELPDLVVSSVNATMSNGEEITLSFTLDNLGGDGPDEMSTVNTTLYFSKDAVLDDSDLMGPIVIGKKLYLKAGWHFEQGPTTSALLGTPAGEYYVIVKVDYPDYVIESNEQNNWQATSETVTVGPVTPQYSITVNKEGNGTVILNPPDGPYDENTPVSLQAVADSGWVFDHWEGDLVGSTNPQTVEIQSDMTVTAVFTQLPAYTLSVETVGQGRVILNPSGGSYTAGTTVRLAALPQDGWQFDHWEGDLAGSIAIRNLLMDGDKSVTAVFTELPPPSQFTLSTSVSAGQGTISADPAKDIYDADETVTLTAQPVNGWKVKSWSGTDSDPATGQTSVQIVMNADRQVSIEFEQIMYGLSVQVAGGHGSMTLDPSGSTYPAGTVVTMTVEPEDGWRVTDWQGALVTPATGILINKVVMTDDKQVTIGTKQITGSVSISIIPTVAAQAGAQWQIDGGAYHNSDDVVSNLPIGTYTVEFKSITGWTTPNSISLNVLDGQTSTGTGAYVQEEVPVVETGSLRVVLTSSDGPVDPLSKWRIVGQSTWLPSGYLMSDMTAGDVTIEFKPVTGCTTPANQTAQIQTSQTATITGTYVPVQQEQQPAVGSLKVALAATEAARWRIDGGSWQATGVTVDDLPVGTYSVDFSVDDNDEWIAPASITIEILEDYTTSISPVFTQVKKTVYVTPQDEDHETKFSLQKAIDQAKPGDTIVVAAGTYSGPGNCDLDFHGKAITLQSADGPETCIIDCGGSELESHRGFYFHSQETATSVLDGFTITGGYATVGGGIFCSDNSNPTIRNCVIKANSCEYSGAGLRCNASSPKVIDCVISGNIAQRTGGGVFFYENSQPILTQCTIEDNMTLGCGGGVYCCVDSQLTLTNCLIANNTAQTSGGGMYCAENSNVFLYQNTISDNTANLGGAIRLYQARVTSINNIIWNNTSELSGYSINNYQSTANFVYCDIEACGGSGENWNSAIGNDSGGNIDMDPVFAGSLGQTLSSDFDYHLSELSPCIDAGTPSSACHEPSPNGGRVNMGVYGNTAQAAASIDSDNDGLLNSVEVRWGMNPLSPDTDGDGLTDYQEVALMGNASSYDPYILTTGKGTGFNANCPDTDGDGVSDYDEAGYDLEPGLYNPYSTTNTGGVDMNAVSADTDGDGMPDGWEKQYPSILDPINPNDANIDSDGDGYTNIEECKGFSNPNDPDSVPVGFRYEFEISRVRYGNSDDSSKGAVSLLVEPLDGRTIKAIILTRPGSDPEYLAHRNPAFYDQNDLMGQDDVSLAAVEAAFPAGVYTLRVSFTDDTQDTITFEHWYSVYPAYVQVDQPTDEQSLSTTAAITWSQANCSKINVVDTALGQSVLSSSIVSGTTVYTIPSGTLSLDRDYELSAVNDNALAPYLASTTVVPFDTDEQKTIIYVDARATGSEDGSSWKNAYLALAPVLSESLQAGTEIRVAQGSYAPDDGLVFIQDIPADYDYRQLSFQLAPGVTIKGSYAGIGADDPDARSIQTTPTILSGVLSSPTGNAYHVVTGADNAVLDGVIITGGNSIDALEDCCGQTLGGGVLCSGTSPTLSNCVLTGNHAEYGGGVYSDSGNPILVNCVLSENSATYGAGVFAANGTIKLINCTIAGNQATDFGGGLLGWKATVQMTNSILWYNTAQSGNQIAIAENTQLYATYNCVEGGSEAIYREDGCTLSWMDTNITRNPRFADSSTSIIYGDKADASQSDLFTNYQLSSSSPCIDAGDNAAISGYNEDLLGQPRRYNDSAVDLGAMEFQGEHVLPSVTELVLSKVDVKSGRQSGIGSLTLGGPINLDRELLENAEFIYVKAGPYELEFEIDQALLRQTRQQMIFMYPLGGTSRVTLKFDFNKQTFELTLKNVDLGGLSCPMVVTIEIGQAYTAKVIVTKAMLSEIGKSLPIQLLNGYADALRVARWNLRQNDSQENRDMLKVSGEIAVKDLTTDISQYDMTIRWGEYSIILPAETLYRRGNTNSFVYKKPKDLTHPAVSATINLDRCTFAITINKADIPDQELPLTFGLSFAGFDEEATVNN